MFYWRHRIWTVFISESSYYINVADSPWRSVTRQSVHSAEWQFTRSFLRYLLALVCGGECDPVPLCPPPRAPESFPYFAASCWCGDRWCYSKSRGNPDGFPFVLGPVSTTLPHFLPERRYFEDFRAGMGTSTLVLKKGGRGGGSFPPMFGVCIICLTFFNNQVTELAGWVWTPF